MTKLKISTRLRDGIKDVEGDAILKKLQDTGIDMTSCEVGQVFYIDMKQWDEQVCDILVKDLLYHYTVELIDA